MSDTTESAAVALAWSQNAFYHVVVSEDTVRTLRT